MYYGLHWDTQLRTIVVEKIITHSLGNIVVDVINFDTQPRNIVVDKIIRHTLGNIVMDGIYCDIFGDKIYRVMTWETENTYSGYLRNNETGFLLNSHTESNYS